MRGAAAAVLRAVWAASLLYGCSRADDGSSASATPQGPAAPPIRVEKLTLLPLPQRLVRADVPVTFRLESAPPLPAGAEVAWTLTSAGQQRTMAGRGPTLETTFPSGGTYSVQAKVGPAASNVLEVPVYRVTLADAEGRPLGEGRLSDQVRVLVEDPAAGAPAAVTIAGVTLPLAGPPERRLTRTFLLLGDPEDAKAAGDGAIPAVPGGRLELQYRDGPAGAVKVGPSAIHEIPVRFVVVGLGMVPTPEIERAIDLRLGQANRIWEPFGRRFARGPLVRLDQVRGSLLIRGRAAGADGQGRPSRSGVRLDGREISIAAAWKNDGAPSTPKATARALIDKAGKSFQIDVFEGLLSGDREAVVLRVRRRDGTPVTVERLAEGDDLAQAVTPLPSPAPDGIEVAPSPELLSLEEIALLAAGKGSPSPGFDVFVVAGLRSLQARPAFKVYPDGVFPAPIAGSAIVAWTLMDGTGRFPYGLARVAGEMLMPPGVRPGPDDTLFAEPLSESPGVDAHKRVSAATGAKIAERGRGLSGKK